MDPCAVGILAGMHPSEAEEYRDMYAGLRVETRELVVMPVNDGDSCRGGGTHWALLVLHKGKWRYLDSAGSFISNAKDVVNNVHIIWGGIPKKIEDYKGTPV